MTDYYKLSTRKAGMRVPTVRLHTVSAYVFVCARKREEENKYQRNCDARLSNVLMQCVVVDVFMSLQLTSTCTV